ncbi:uncharacterized protein LOC135197513 [Macrobrachium nipponense]|uniref:uncharacterized protein LOC135197513 n=1 Tax=Macrobrachium nipponense TaxID=159736 RepID=UPI0030C8232B
MTCWINDDKGSTYSYSSIVDRLDWNAVPNMQGSRLRPKKLMKEWKIRTDKVVNIISTYAPQMGCQEQEKELFRQEFEALIRTVKYELKLIIEADMNGRVGKRRDGYERYMEAMGLELGMKMGIIYWRWLRRVSIKPIFVSTGHDVLSEAIRNEELWQLLFSDGLVITGEWQESLEKGDLKVICGKILAQFTNVSAALSDSVVNVEEVAVCPTGAPRQRSLSHSPTPGEKT